MRRGVEYARDGRVLDLQEQATRLEAKVAGSDSAPSFGSTRTGWRPWSWSPWSRGRPAWSCIRARHDVTLVEGAGGLLVPFAGALTTVDLIARFDIPVLIVARVGLGTINHTGLSVEHARARGLDVAGVVFTRGLDPDTHPPGPDEARNPDTIARLFDLPVLGNIPYLPDADPAKALPYLDLDALGA